MKSRWLSILLAICFTAGLRASQAPYIQLTQPKLPSGEVYTGTSGVTQVLFSFTEPITFVAADIFIVNNSGNLVSCTASGSGTNCMKIVFGQPLLNDEYTITVLDSVIGRISQLAIDGDRDGVAGGNAVIKLRHNKRSDFDSNAAIGVADLAIFADNWLSDGPPAGSIQLLKRDYLTGILPEPQEVYDFASVRDDFKFKNNTVIVVENSADMIGAQLIAEDLFKRLGFNLSIVQGDVPLGITSFVFLGRSGTIHNFENHVYPLAELGQTRTEGYRLAVDSFGIVIDGNDERGTLYGVQTLRQLIKADGTVHAVAIRDWPEMAWRLSYPGLIELDGILEHVKRCARLKINGIVLETIWSGGQNWWYSPSPENQAKANQFFSECRKYKIEPIPLIQGLGWGYGATDRDPMTAEGKWVQNEAVVLRYSNASELSKANVVATKTGPIVVKRQNGNTCIEGTDYTVIPGETCRPYNATNAKWKLQGKSGGQIADGETVYVSYNAVAPNVHQAYCPSEPRTYSQVDMAVDYTINLYNPSVIHIGHDEVWQSRTCSRCIKSGLPESEIILGDVLHWYNRIKRLHPNIKVLMWYDLLRQDSGKLLSVADRLPKDIILMPWIYETGSAQRTAMVSNLNLEASMGFQSIGTSAGYWTSNSLDWHESLKPKLVPAGNALGMMFSVWGGFRHHEIALPSAAELMWHGQSEVDLDLYNMFASKMAGLVNPEVMYLTFELNTQSGTLGTYFNNKLNSGMTPQQIASYFRATYIGGQSIFLDRYSQVGWSELSEAYFAEQQPASLQKFGIIFDLMALYSDAEYLNSQGQTQPAKLKLNDVISGLLKISYIDFATASNLQNSAATRFLSSAEIFGVSLDPYRP